MSYYRFKSIAEAKRFSDQIDAERRAAAAAKSEALNRSRDWLDQYRTQPRPTQFDWRPSLPTITIQQPPGATNVEETIEGEITVMADADASSHGNGEAGEGPAHSQSEHATQPATRSEGDAQAGGEFAQEETGDFTEADRTPFWPVVADALAPQAEAQAINAVRDDWNSVSGVAAMQAPQLIGVDGADDYITNMVSLARKKGGRELLKEQMVVLQGMAKYRGQQEADEAGTRRLIDVQQRISERIVCGFVAEVEMAQMQNRGLPPAMVFNLNSFTVVKIVDALNRAGYKSSGRVNGADREEKREALMGKSHDEVNQARRSVGTFG